MFAVIRSGNKQYRVAPGDTIRVETLPGKPGGAVTFEDVLGISADGKKLVTGKAAAAAKVKGTIVAQDRHRKVIVLKYRRTKQYKIQRGHRQNYTAVQINEIAL